MADPRAAVLAAECEIFVQYLAGRGAPPDVVAGYQRAHEVSAVEPSGRSLALDRALLQLARSGTFGARAADAYAAVFARDGALRRKLVLLVAILESRGDTASALDTARPGSRLLWFFEVGVRATASLLMLCVAAGVILPLSSWYRLFGAGESGSQPRATSIP